MCHGKAGGGQSGLDGIGWSGKTDPSLAELAVTWILTTVADWLSVEPPAAMSMSMELSAWVRN